jgi:hypothetical protein
MAAPTKEDWGKIYAKAWKYPDFMNLLETNPTQALMDYGKEVGKTFDKIIDPASLSPPSNLQDVPEEFWPLLHQTPPACC